MKTKHMLSILSLVLVVLLGIYSCKKEQANNSQPVSLAEKIAADESFMKLNNAMNRFDPQYLVLVYHDARTPKEISDASFEILKKLGEDPNNQTIQKELAGFYHFNSVAEFSMYSNNISEGIQELNTKFNFTKEVTENNKAGEFLKARTIYATREFNKLTEGRNNEHKYKIVTIDGIPDAQEYTDQLISYYRYSMNEGFVGDIDNGGNGCNGDVCCDQRIVCESEARKQLISNLYLYAGGGAIAGAKIGGSVGTAVPGIGNSIGLIGGFFGGGALGMLYSFSIYSTDIDICKSKYQVCLDQKK